MLGRGRQNVRLGFFHFSCLSFLALVSSFSFVLVGFVCRSGILWSEYKVGAYVTSLKPMAKSKDLGGLGLRSATGGPGRWSGTTERRKLPSRTWAGEAAARPSCLPGPRCVQGAREAPRAARACG